MLSSQIDSPNFAHILGRTFRDVLEKTYLDQSATVEGLLPATFEVVFLSGWAPSDTQPKPLRPGSAAARLADAAGSRSLPRERSRASPPLA